MPKKGMDWKQLLGNILFGFVGAFFILAGIILIYQLALGFDWFITLLGIIFLGIGLILFPWSFDYLTRKGIKITPNQRTTVLVASLLLVIIFRLLTFIG